MTNAEGLLANVLTRMREIPNYREAHADMCPCDTCTQSRQTDMLIRIGEVLLERTR